MKCSEDRRTENPAAPQRVSARNKQLTVRLNTQPGKIQLSSKLQYNVSMYVTSVLLNCFKVFFLSYNSYVVIFLYCSSFLYVNS